MQNQQETELLEHVLAVSRRMAEIRELEPLLSYVIDEVLDLVGAERGYIVFMPPDGPLEFKVKRYKDGTEIKNVNDQISHSVLNEVISTAKALVLSNAMTSPRFGQAKSVMHLRLRSIMSVPLITLKGTIGAIYVENRSVRGRFRQKDLIPLELFANQAAILIENARLNDQLSIANGNLMHLLYSITHDLREPLRAIQFFSGFVSKQYASLLDTKGQDYLARVNQAAQHQRQLLDDISFLAIIQQQESITTEIIMLKTVVDVVLMQVQEKIKASGARIQVAPDLPKVHLHRQWAIKAIYHLLDNALNYAQPGKPPQIELMSYNGTEGAGIVVADRGPGIPSEYSKIIFNIFQRATSPQPRSTGAGLTIVRQIAERHNGQAWCRPREGGGTEFIITFGPAVADVESPKAKSGNA